MDQKLASIIIPTRDKLSRLKLVLRALEPQIDDNIEVIIIFDGCGQETIDGFNKLPLSFQPMKLICVQNIGRAAARNLGIRRATGKIIIFLDDDRIPAPDFVKRHVCGHGEERCVLMGKRRELYYTEEEIEQLDPWKPEGNGFLKIMEDSFGEILFASLDNLVTANPRSSVSWFPFNTGNASVEKKDIEEAGLFDENYSGWGYEDTDLGYRLFLLKLRFKKDPLAVNYHLSHPRTSPLKEEVLKNKRYFVRKLHSRPLLRIIYELYRFIHGFAIIKRLMLKRGYRNLFVPR